jgi:hypothetical protein
MRIYRVHDNEPLRWGVDHDVRTFQTDKIRILLRKLPWAIFGDRKPYSEKLVNRVKLYFKEKKYKFKWSPDAPIGGWPAEYIRSQYRHTVDYAIRH